MGYWGRVHKRAVREARALLHIESNERLALALITSVAGILGLLFWDSKDAATQEIIMRAAGIAVIVLLFPAFYAIKFHAVPSVMDREQRDQISDLQKAAEPVLEILFSKDDGLHIVPGAHTPARDSRGNNLILSGTLIRVTLWNRSTHKTVKDARCVIKAVEGYHHAFSNQDLQPLAEDSPLPMPADAKQIITVLFVPDDPAIGKVFIIYNKTAKGSPRIGLGDGLPRKNYTFEIQATGLDIGVTSKKLAVTLDNGVDAHLE